MKVVGNLKELIGEAAEEYISLNSETFRSNVPGPKGDDGVQGPEGVGVHHLKGTSTTQNEGNFAYPGETDTYTFYPDANETYPLGWFNVKNGSRGPIGYTGLAPRLQLSYSGGNLVLNTVGYVEASEQVEWSEG